VTPLLPLKPEVFRILRALIEERIGISYADSDRDLVAEKLGARALEAGFDSLLDYYYYLRYDASSAGEFDALVDALVVGETYFFRELQQLRTLVDEYIAPLVAAGQTPRLWSAACATGEEPLTLAMLLADAGLLDRVQIVASDVSRRALERARRGEFGHRALRTVPCAGLDERWIRVEEGRVHVRRQLIETIDWRRLNLVDMDAMAELGSFHAIVCRNVLIYFSEQTTARVVSNLRNQLTPGGVLVVGVSESLLRFGSGLVCEERGGAFFYRKPE
jgi:chemotaxis protein methyltransferase CheR